MRARLGDERRDPEGRLEALLADGLEDALHVAAEGLPRFQPVAHRGLIAVVELDVLELRDILRDGGEIVHDVAGGDARSEAIPTAPAGGRVFEVKRRVIRVDSRGELRQ